MDRLWKTKEKIYSLGIVPLGVIASFAELRTAIIEVDAKSAERRYTIKRLRKLAANGVTATTLPTNPARYGKVKFSPFKFRPGFTD